MLLAPAPSPPVLKAFLPAIAIVVAIAAPASAVTVAVTPAAPASVAAIPAPEPPQLVRVEFGPGQSITDLLRAGLDITDVHGGGATLLAWPGDADRLARLGFAYGVLDPHPGRTAADRARAELAAQPTPKSSRVWSATGKDGRFRIATLPPFGSGSMGGYWTSAEIKMKLDQLVANDANDVVADQIDTVGYSREGRPIWGLRIAKATTGPDLRPVVFFNALTHAREPGGMQALFYFVDDILAHYGSDPWASYLLDQRVIYIVPLVNPDGYAVNEASYFGGGGFGMWRKNTRDNNNSGGFDSNDGVDINRNYSYKWGFDDTGSSPSSSSETYRGPAAVSEPETQTQRNLVVALRPVTGLSFHTYSDLMIHPWGYTFTQPPDLAAFREWSDELTRDNGYLSGQGPRILYSVNGEFNDWTYGDTLAKPKAFTWTPEIGGSNDGFWPPPSRILPLAQEMLLPCYRVSAFAGPYVQEDGVTLTEGAMNSGFLTHVSVRARNLAAQGTAGPGVLATLVPLDAGAHVVSGEVSYPDLLPRQSAGPLGGATFLTFLEDSVTPGRLMRFEIRFTAGNLFSRDTIAIPAGTPTVLLADPASGFAKWVVSPSGAWSVVLIDAGHPDRYIGEALTGDYPPNANDLLILRPRFDFSAGVHAYATYETKWEFEQDVDSGSLEASFDSVTWTPVHASGSTAGSGLGAAQVAGKPYYAGARQRWKFDIADLSPFTGPTRTRVALRFRGQSDGGTEFDGLAVDSVRIEVYDPAAQPVSVAVGDRVVPPALALAAPFPNPALDRAQFGFALPSRGQVRIEILDLQGRRLRMLADGALEAGRHVRAWDLRDDRGRRVPPGICLVRLSSPDGVRTRRLVLLTR